jgi:hypothetical protein
VTIGLMPQRIEIGAKTVAAVESLAAASAGGRFERDDAVALLGWNQGPLVPKMARLSAAIAFRFWLGGRRLGVRMLRARRQRGILRRPIQPGLEFRHSLLKRRDMSQQRENDRLRLRRLPSNHFLRDFQRHAPVVAQIQLSEKINPGRERLPRIHTIADRARPHSDRACADSASPRRNRARRLTHRYAERRALRGQASHPSET